MPDADRRPAARVLFAILLSAALATARAQVPVIEKISPEQAYLEAGGAYTTLLIRGSALDKITGYEVRREGAASTYLWAQSTPVENGRTGVILLARADAPRDLAYTLHFQTAAGTGGALPLVLTVVEPGDARALAEAGATARDAVNAAAGASSVVIAAEQTPRISSTRPDPLVVPPTGNSTTLALLGENLDGISEVRVRRASQPARYRGRQGVLAFRRIPGGLEVDVQASPKATGQSYVLDLMIGSYRAASLSFLVGEPGPSSPPVTVPTPTLPVRGRVIDLPAIQPLQEPVPDDNPAVPHAPLAP